MSQTFTVFASGTYPLSFDYTARQFGGIFNAQLQGSERRLPA